MMAICAAMRWELRPLLRAFGPVRRLRGRRPATWSGGGDWPVLIFQTGIGIEAARSATSSVLAEFPVTAVINAGCAGALAAGMETGSVVVATAVLRGDLPSSRSPTIPRDGDLEPAPNPTREGPHDRSRYPTEKRLSIQLVAAARSLGLQLVHETILSSPLPLATRTAKRRAREELGAVAVEMEGAGVAQASAEHGVHFASVRVILDRADQDLAFVEAGHPGRGLILPRALAALARPGVVRRLADLRSAMRTTETTLETVFLAFRRDSQREEWFDDEP